MEVCPKSNTLEFRAMTGHEEIKIFVNINIPALLPSSYKCVNEVKKLWDDFYELYCRICSDYLNDVEIDQLQGDINEWVELFLKCFPTDNVTPYIHALKQLMLRRSCITILENEGHTREKRDIHCRNCQSEGHAILTCSTLCSSCDESVCCRHLEKMF